MNRNLIKVYCAFIATACLSSATQAAQLGTAFSFQGELLDGGAPVTAQCDFEFTLWDDAAAGVQVGPAVTQTIDVADGRFTTLLDFGAGIFTGDARWVEINVCCTSPCSPVFTTLTPRQEVTPAPYALHAANAPDGHSLDASDGDPVDAVFVDADGKVGIGTTAPDAKLHIAEGEIWVGGTNTIGSLPPSAGAGIRMHNGLSDGVSKIYAYDYVSGTPRDLALQHAGGNLGIGTSTPGERLTVAGTVESTTGGFKFPDGTVQTTAAAGGGGNTLDAAYDEGGAGAGRTITADTGAVEIQGPDGLVVAGTVTSGSSIIIDGSAGAEKITSTDALEIHTSTGRIMRLEPEAVNFDGNLTSPNVIAGWSSNSISPGVVGATISGGGAFEAPSTSWPNTVTDDFGTVGGGLGNTVGNDNGFFDISADTVGGGQSNTASGGYSTVSGGENNSASSGHSTVGGGNGNTASSSNATVGGGFLNTASGLSAVVGGGSYNTASGGNATVPGGQGNVALGAYSFAAGNRAKANHPGSFVWADSQSADLLSNANNQFIVRAAGGIWFGTNSSAFVPTGRFISTSTGASLTSGGTWTNSSDRAAKENITPIDPVDILDRLRDVPVSQWNYKSEDDAVLHMGPMAQDLYAAFGLGDSDKSISTIDADGVALAAIQGLHSLVEEKDCQIEELEQQNAALEARFSAMEETIKVLERRINGGSK